MNFNDKSVGKTTGFFSWLVRRPKRVLLSAAVAILLSALGLGSFVRDPSLDAFVPKVDNSYIAAERAKTLFGLADPIAIGVFWDEDGAVFLAENLELIHSLHRAIESLPNVRYQGVTSLASESYVEDSDESVLISPYIDAVVISDSAARRAAEGWRMMPPHQGTLVSQDARAATILVEIEDSRVSDQTYDAILDLIAEYPANATFHVAGIGAIVGYLGQSISADVRVLVPLIYLVVLIVIFTAFRRLKTLIVPLPVIVGAVTGALGLMAAFGIPYYAITSALPVVIVAIAVADTIHILSAYREAQANSDTIVDKVVVAMVNVVRPITLTTITTVIGFIAIALVSTMPPLMYFAWFAAFGIALAWAFSLTCIPAMIVLVKLNLTPLGTRDTSLLAQLGRGVIARPVVSLALLLPIVLTAGTLATRVEVDRALVESFPKSAPIRQADSALNTHFSGTAFLDVMVEAADADGLLDPDAMMRIAALQDFMERLPGIQKTIAITDFVGQIDRAINGASDNARAIPASMEAVAQYLFLYEASGRPDQLSQQIDNNYQHALVRGILNTRAYSEETEAVTGLQSYIDDAFSGDKLKATLSGRVNTRHHWMNDLALSHVLGVALSIICIFLASAWLFRSVLLGIAAISPVVLSVCSLYAVMAATGTHLEPATSMYAAISIGVGIDYAIHLVHRLRAEVNDGAFLRDAVAASLSTTGRACLFNAASLGLGFAVLTASDLMTLKYFGVLMSAAAFVSFFAAMFLVPLFFRLTLGRLFSVTRESPQAVGVLLALSLIPMAWSANARADVSAEGRALAEAIHAREEGQFARKTLEFELIRPSGSVRRREAITLRATDEDRRATLIVFTAPKVIRETAFLSHQQFGSADESRWLFLPATSRVRRLPSSERGDYFLGTDLTYADIQSELKFDLDDYEFSAGEFETRNGKIYRTLSGRSRTPEIATETGYGGFTALVDTTTYLPKSVVFDDPDGRLLKTIEVVATDEIAGIAFATKLTVKNERSGHQTVLLYRDVTFPETIDTGLLQPTRMRRGIANRL